MAVIFCIVFIQATSILQGQKKLPGRSEKPKGKEMIERRPLKTVVTSPPSYYINERVLLDSYIEKEVKVSYTYIYYNCFTAQTHCFLAAISQSGCNVRGHCSPKFFCLFCLMFNCIQIALLLGHIYVKLQSTVFHIKEIIEEYLRLHWRGYGRDNLFIYLKWISFCGKNISFVHILFLCYWN